jgi:hypothetical protein
VNFRLTLLLFSLIAASFLLYIRRRIVAAKLIEIPVLRIRDRVFPSAPANVQVCAAVGQT